MLQDRGGQGACYRIEEDGSMLQNRGGQGACYRIEDREHATG